MLPFFKPTEEWTVDDLRLLVEQEVREDEDLEFKRDFYQPTDGGKRELLRDVTAMANQRGGFIVIGIAQDRRGAAKELVGIDPLPEERLEGWVADVVLRGIEPRLPETAIRSQRIPISSSGEGRVCLVIQVPPSWAGPYMVRFQDSGEFWIRHGARKARMSWLEVRAMFERSLQGELSVRQYVSECHSEAYEGWKQGYESLKREAESKGGSVRERKLFLVSATPTFSRLRLIDVKDPSLARVFVEGPDTRPPWNQR